MYAVVLLVSLVKQSYTRLCCLSLFIQNKIVVSDAGRGGRTLVRESFLILSGPERGSGRVGD